MAGIHGRKRKAGRARTSGEPPDDSRIVLPVEALSSGYLRSLRMSSPGSEFATTALRRPLTRICAWAPALLHTCASKPRIATRTIGQLHGGLLRQAVVARHHVGHESLR